EEELIFACAEAMREEYRAILEAGLVLQLDDPAIAENWDMINPAPTVEEYRKLSMIRVEALNHALRGLPKDRVRFHLCWGRWHGPHVTDIPMRDIVDVMLAVDCQAYSFEAGNVRHEHEWKVWRDVKLAEDKILIPGVVSHATNVVEHPELVADRIVRFAELVGRERLMAGTDCGPGGPIPPAIAPAKPEPLARGAAPASGRPSWPEFPRKRWGGGAGGAPGAGGGGRSSCVPHSPASPLCGRHTGFGGPTPPERPPPLAATRPDHTWQS